MITLKEILDDTEKGYAIGQFNVHNLEYVQGVVEAARATQSPVIIGITERPLRYYGINYLVNTVKAAEKNCSVPLCLHLDHGDNLAVVFECIEAGFSSVMYDGSHLSLEDNIQNTKLVVKRAKEYGIYAEAELGELQGIEDGKESTGSTLTAPDEAEYFVKETGISALAVAIGTAHGFYSGEPKLDFERLKAIRDRVDIPLVLHGGSGVPEKSIKKAIKIGISKVNVGTELKVAFNNGIKSVWEENPEEIECTVIMGAAREGVKEKVIEKINLFRSNL
ncbi:ketose-bisphosphate aldolase [Iocasia frigidifontis]|uniref:Ketose-bisphosphate aldolase n=1 Tax=Iocasia fonsfrigidae TaxID=2682810 RepID=A0A8A7KES3_9FIRM|nr:class II fructose-bisphosphate aldolase [Iocasia fonsfrigidae]QTL99760.1 ketose-bisphosphate aldolase [Iocasia fonsfrigidae]